MTDIQAPQLPTHLGFIVDGNRRWAKQNGLSAQEGHMAGYNVVKDMLRAAVGRGIKYISFYVFSTENWKRTEDEVSHLMNMTIRFTKGDVKELVQENTRLRILGRREGLSKKVAQVLQESEEQTAHCTRADAIFCFNYGGQQEIADAAQACAQEDVEITPKAIRQHLYYPDIPDVDMVVRTSGEQRISNFMLWRAAYSEFLFLDKLWPDLRPEDLDSIIEEYSKRQRRFGGN